MAVADAWRVLLQQGRKEAGWHSIRVEPDARTDIQVGVRQPDGVLAVLFLVRSRAVPAGTAYPESVGFALVPEPVQPGPNGTVRLCLELRDPVYRDLFDALADDVVGAVKVAEDDAQCVRLLLGRLATWLRFAARFGPGVLSPEARIGLFAELRFFSAHVLGRMPAAFAVNAWRGPLGESHDFDAASLAIEVKANSTDAPSTIVIANLDQLDCAQGSRLLLHHVSVHAGGNGLSLSTLVEDVRARIEAENPAARADFDARLNEAGYFDVHADSYKEPAYVAGPERWFDVVAGFPRLTRASVPLGLLRAEYSVSISACEPFEKDTSEVERLIEDTWR